MKLTDKQKTQPVTTLVRHEIVNGREADFEAWSDKIRTACRSYEGYLGTEVIKPVDGADNCFVSIFRFDSFANLDRWMKSDERTRIVAEADKFSAAGPDYSQYHSLEYLFTDAQRQKAPSREKMALVTYLGLIPPVYFIPPLVVDHASPAPLVVTMISLAIITPLMVYAIMPILTKITSKWLFK